VSVMMPRMLDPELNQKLLMWTEALETADSQSRSAVKARKWLMPAGELSGRLGDEVDQAAW
jgi:hypothetical protein